MRRRPTGLGQACLLLSLTWAVYAVNHRGFTLLELLVVVAVIGILAATAIAAYGRYRLRAYEAVAISYMSSWVPAQELYLQKFGHYADADETLATPGFPLKVPPASIPYDFSIDSGSNATTRWWGQGAPTKPNLRHFYIDNTGVVGTTPLP